MQTSALPQNIKTDEVCNREMENSLYRLIAKHLASETTKADKIALQTLLKDAGNKQVFEQAKGVWGKTDKLKPTFDTNKGIAVLRNKISRKQTIRKIFRFAAIFIGLISLSGFLVSDAGRTEHLYANNALREVVLPDSTVVVLNKNAILQYGNSRLWSFNRKVLLTGEAYFKVSKQNGKQFSVGTPGLTVTVLGTAFNLRAFEHETEVVLTEGEVKLTGMGKHNDLYMLPGDYVHYNTTSNKLTKKTVVPNIYATWLSNRLKLDQLTFADIKTILERKFNKTVIVRKQIPENVRLSGSAPANDPEAFIMALSEILNVDFTIKNDTILIE